MQKTSSIVPFALKGLVIAGILMSLSACKGFPFRPAPKGTQTVTLQGTETAGTPAISGQANIIMQDNAFHPQKLTVKVGTTIIWVNKDPAFHSVIEDDNVFHSTLLAIGQSFSFTFDNPGTYPYYCGVKGGPGGTGMSGEITVIP
jgi:plastocyanin